MSQLNDMFRLLARKVSAVVGQARTFTIAILLVLVWLVTGPYFHYSDSWQLIINTSTTIITFLMVFLIQNTQNRESKAIQIKLDELIRAVKSARNSIIDIEDTTDDQIEELKRELRALGGSRYVDGNGKPQHQVKLVEIPPIRIATNNHGNNAAHNQTNRK